MATKRTAGKRGRQGTQGTQGTKEEGITLGELLARQERERRDLSATLAAPIVEVLWARTRDWAVAQGYEKGAGKKLSPRAAAVQAYLTGTDFGCYAAKVTGLVSLLLGEDLHHSSKDKEIRPQVGVVVVPTGNDNGHNYDLDRAAVFFSVGHWWCYSARHPRGTGGNSMTARRSNLRPATREEIAGLCVDLLVLGDKEVQGFLRAL